jgi:hypothetical protein
MFLTVCIFTFLFPLTPQYKVLTDLNGLPFFGFGFTPGLPVDPDPVGKYRTSASGKPLHKAEIAAARKICSHSPEQ